MIKYSYDLAGKCKRLRCAAYLRPNRTQVNGDHIAQNLSSSLKFTAEAWAAPSPHFFDAWEASCRTLGRTAEEQVASTVQCTCARILSFRFSLACVFIRSAYLRPPNLTPFRVNGTYLPHQDTAVRQIAAEIKELLEPLLEILTTHKNELRTDSSYAGGAVVYHRSIERNKRCALAYLFNRLHRIQAHRWEAGASSHLTESMSGPESQFLNEYNKLLGAYCDAVELDLTADRKPPRDLYIEVRVLRDCGSVVTDAGSVALKPGTAHFLKRSDVEHLIRQGALEHIC